MNPSHRPIAHSALLTLCVSAMLACNGTSTSATQANTSRVKAHAFPTNFTPPPPLEKPLPPADDKLGRVYLESVHHQIGDPWRTFLDDCRLRLPPNHPLNTSTLSAVLHLSIDVEGKLHGAAMEQPSGQPEFDEAAQEIVREAAPFPPPPPELISDDDKVHIMWLLARDRRQAGVATAEVRNFKWPARRSVPKYLAQNDITTASMRLLEELQRDKPATSEQVKMGTQIAEAAIRESLASEQASAQLLAVKSAGAARLVSAAEGFRRIIDTSVDTEIRAHAIRALGDIGDHGAAQLLISVLDTAKGSGVGGKVDASIAAAIALAALGRAPVAESTVLKWFRTPEKESLWAALLVMSEFPVPAAVPVLAQITGDELRSRDVRMAACIALGVSTTRTTASKNMKVLRKRFDDKDAAVRTACIEGVARATRGGVKNRFTYWQLIERIKKDRDERVRAAAVRAASLLDPGLFQKEMYLLRKEKSVPVLAAIAAGLKNSTEPLAFKKLVSLAKHESHVVRRRAAASLIDHPNSRARKTLQGLIDDPDMQVRVTAIRALDNKGSLNLLMESGSPDVRRAAFGSLIRVSGKRRLLERMLRGILENPKMSLSRTIYASTWLTPDV